MFSNSGLSRPLQSINKTQHALNRSQSHRQLSGRRKRTFPLSSFKKLDGLTVRRSVHNQSQSHLTRMAQQQTLIYVPIAVRRRRFSRTGLGCVFVLGRKFLVRNGLGRVRIRSGGMDVWRRMRVYGLVQVEPVRIMDCLLREDVDLD